MPACTRQPTSPPAPRPGGKYPRLPWAAWCPLQTPTPSLCCLQNLGSLSHTQPNEAGGPHGHLYAVVLAAHLLRGQHFPVMPGRTPSPAASPTQGIKLKWIHFRICNFLWRALLT